ncbi:hypothetical protein F511_17969 [Dorcoceras hygrometricum]|uniref:Uncharacterized protein n=1 Tax=Dorcoceras hygrometricum TaxID=472368 RepID=A0A2Z7ADG2_9LAMI|nr:hypothetical protein F511_17969 [Dorcoceras hygrometricum]
MRMLSSRVCLCVVELDRKRLRLVGAYGGLFDTVEYSQVRRLKLAILQLRDHAQRWWKVSHTVAAGVHLWSLGVLTAAGCGIGSVHEVVRSNILVEPSEVEEGEM